MVVMITGFIPMEPLVAFADSIDKPFSITNTSFSDDGATLSWEYSYKEGSETSFELDTNLELEEEATGNLISEGKEIGTYTISTEGKLQIEINEEDVKNIIKEENQDVVVPAENLEITTDESISVEVEKPLEKTFTGSFEVSGAKEKQNEKPPFNLFGDISLFGGPSGNNVTNILTNLNVKVTQSGQEIIEGGTFTNAPIEIDISFGVPVPGDAPTPTQPVKHGDYASWTIEGFTLVGGTTEFDLNHEGIKVGTLKYIPSVDGKSVEIRVDFDGDPDIFDEDKKEFNTVVVEFEADLKYVGNEQGNEDQNYTVTILGKTFTVNVPAIAKEFKGTKTGVKNGDTIDWKIKIEGTQGEQNINLGGMKLVDDITTVGELIGNFKYNSTDDIAGATDFAENLVVESTGVYTLQFPEATVSPVYVYFTTQISEDFVTNGERTITNTAKLFEGEDEKLTVSDSVKFENRWIEKTAGTTEYIMEDGKLVAYITWYITVNHMGASLPNARIIDELDSRLEFVEAEWYTKDINGLWVGSGLIALDETWDKKTYPYPNPPLNQNVQLRIKTKVDPNQNIGHTQINIGNQARLEWDNGPEHGIGSGSIDVGIGTNPISKSAGSYDAKTHTIPWTVTVQKSDVSVDLRVIDILVYGTTFDYSKVSSIEKAFGNGNGLENLDKATLDLIQGSLTPSVRQKYKPSSFSSNHGLTHTVYTLKDNGGKAIADLIVVSEDGGTIDLSGGNKSFSFKTIVTDPAWYLSNSNNTVRNTAMLFSANNKLNQRQADIQISPRSTFKDMLRSEASTDPLANKNNRTTNSGEGFNYKDKSVVFRLFVNQNGVNATGGITTEDGAILGDVIVEDILPSGWEFVDIEEGTKFYLFNVNASGSPNSMTVGDRITDYGDILGSSVFSEENRKATFTFTKLEEPYAIFVKARPTGSTLNGYFNDNKTTTVTNTLNLKSAHHPDVVTSSQEVRIISQVLGKEMTKLENGVLKWTVSYRPYDIFQNVQVLNQYRLIDTLPEGLEIYTDSQGNLNFSDGNFVVTEMELTPSGYVPSGQIFTEEQLKNYISYNAANRQLIFTIPNKDKAYRLEYKTMVTANSGNLTNTVALEGVSLNSVNTSRNYAVASADASATMSRNGWIEVEKVNQNGSKLAGSRFTVFTSDKSLALRTGVTDSQGKVVLRGLPIGEYILMEKEAPSGYTVSNREYIVSVTRVSGNVVTSIDGKIGTDSNKIKVTNFQEGTSGNLKVSKTVSGNDGDESKAFDFTLQVGNITGQKDFTKTDTNGSISFGSLSFNNGSASFSLKHNENITIIGLPKDLGYTITENDYSADGYETYVNDSLEKSRVHTGAISVDTTHQVSFKNIKDTFGDLLIEKIVAGNAGDLEKQFTFVLKFENPSTGSYTYEGLGGKSNGTLNLDSEGKATISLKHGESIRIKDLPKGLSYTIEEQIDAEDIYDVSVDGVDTNKTLGNIEDSSEKTVTFTNSKSTFGNLVVRKNVDGLLGELERPFKFTLQMGELEVKTYEFEVRNSNGNVISSGNMTFDEGNKAEFSLKNGESIKIKGLPNRAAYSLSEENVDGYITTTSGNENGAIVGKSTPEVVFNNTRSTHGTLEIDKVVTGNGGDILKEFNFNLSVENLENGLYPAKITNKQTNTTRDVSLNFVDGKASFKLKHNEKLSVNLPKDLSYVVTEEDYSSAGYTTQTSGDSTGKIIVNETLKTTFTNNRQVSTGGGGGGGTPPVVPPVTPPVVPPVTPPVVPPVTPPVVPPVTPPVVPPVTPPITTPENTPIGGQVDIPDEGVPTVVVPPQNGEVTIDEDGNWVYTPNPGFVGEDSFTIVISSPDGDEEVVIDIEVEEIPLGVVTPPSEEDINGDLPTGVPVLPKTGAIDSTFYYLLGAILIFIGFKIRRR